MKKPQTAHKLSGVLLCRGFIRVSLLPVFHFFVVEVVLIFIELIVH